MIIVGAGRVGRALETRAAMRGVPCVLVSRREGWEEIRPNGSGPILLATRNDDLVDVAAKIPPERWPDVTAVQTAC